MIKRTSSNKITPSLVNAAQEEHQNVVHAIKDGAPITDLTSVVKSINFDTDTDGAFILRNPLVLKEKMSKDSYYLYDNKTKFNVDDKILSYESDTGIKFIYYDLKFKRHEINIPNDMDKLNFIVEYFKHINTKDSTIISVKIDRDILDEWLEGDEYPSILYPDADLNYGQFLYRFLKIYIDPDSQDTVQWVIELVHPEINTITSATDVSNAESLDFNLLLDNPYAIRDLYNYGINGTTKILAYAIDDSQITDIDALTIYELTESKKSGICLIESLNTNSLIGNTILLKAFITTMKEIKDSNLKFYCCWEYSTNNGIDWQVSQAFLDKFAGKGKIVVKNVSDLDAIEFEKAAYDETLSKPADYIIEKKMVVFNPNTVETDLIEDRPDVLKLNSSSLSYLYRFQIYVDTGKEYPKVDPSDFTSEENITSSTFTNAGFITPVVFPTTTSATEPTKLTSYSTFLGNTTVEPSISIPTGSLVLSKSDDSDLCGNTMVFNIKDSTTANYEIVKIEVTATATENVSLGCVPGTIAEVSNNSIFETKTIGSTDTTVSFLNTQLVSPETSDYTGYKQVTLACCSDVSNITISKIKIYFRKSTEPVKTTTTYLSSTTGSFGFTYSENTKYLEDLSYYRTQLFKGNLVYYENQLISFNKYSVYFSNVDSFIMKSLNTLTFGTPVTKIIKWRSYLVVFTTNSINLVGYDTSTDSYILKTISTNIGISEVDADTVTVILNTIYFKSGDKIYRLTLNAYTSDDSLLNLRYISLDINTFLTEMNIHVRETHNFCFADARFYYIFINSDYDLEENVSKEVTYCLKYDYTIGTWNILKYNLSTLDIDILDIDTAYLRTELGLCYFREDPKAILSHYYLETQNVLLGYRHFNDNDDNDNYDDFKLGAFDENSNEFKLCAYNSDIIINPEDNPPTYIDMLDLYDELPYADYFNHDLKYIYEFVRDHINEASSDIFKELYEPIVFSIDFGQKSSTYTLVKQFLETKFTFGTLQARDMFPITLDIETDGESMNSKPDGIHIDANTDSALWKTNLDHKGTLSTVFGQSINTNYNGIMRQLIVKYSGKGKTIRYLITGNSKSKFKFYSLDTRYRILAKKQ